MFDGYLQRAISVPNVSNEIEWDMQSTAYEGERLTK
jgi:hypothetical protein